jgi:flagellin
MRINTNVSALNAQRQLGLTNNNVSKSITRLSSGFRINRAADDAAGLGIANKLRGDIRSMSQAARNGEQANSLAQIAEGAVSGVASMLDRMKELATQANSDTVDLAGRQRLNAEFVALRSEIGRTAATTQFGSTKLINGTMGNSVNDAAAQAVTNQTFVEDVTISGVAAGVYELTATANAGTVTFTLTNAAADLTQVKTTSTAGAQTVAFEKFGVNVELNSSFATTDTITSGTNSDITVVAGSNGGEFMVGSSGAYADASGAGDLLTFSNIDMTTGAAGLNIDGLDLLDATNAQAALTGLDTAIDTVNESLGSIGAFQNRIENAVANLKTGIENLSASESVIRDLDMAAEMTNFSKNQILAQAGTAMLAQANQSSQNVLQLLRG